jgi:molybdopterin molybdotransferase
MHAPEPLTIDAALAAVLAEATPLPEHLCADPAEAHGAVLARDLHARFALPAADTSIMDGWALRAADLTGARPALAIHGESAAGRPLTALLPPGSAARIATGALVPPGADAVIAQEDAERRGALLHIDLDAAGPVRPGHFVRRAGSEVSVGELLLPAGAHLGPGELALLYGAGHHPIPVHRRPRVALLSTGDELAPLGSAPRPGHVISTNALMLAAQLREVGAVVLDLGIVGDDLEATVTALDRAGEADLLLTTGGISVGDHDHVAAALGRRGFAPIFRKVALRPGRPLTFGRLRGALVFALPGNPASAYVTFELLVRPLLRRLLGHRDALTWPRRQVILDAAVEGAGARAHVIRAKLTPEGHAVPLPQQRSGSLRSLSGHDLLLLIPAGTAAVPAGSSVEALHLDRTQR